MISLFHIALFLTLEISKLLSPFPEQPAFFCLLKHVLENAFVPFFAGWLLFNTLGPNNASKERSLALQVTTNLRQTLWKQHFELSLDRRIIAPSHDSSKNYCFCLLHLLNFLRQLQSSFKHRLCFRRGRNVLAFTPWEQPPDSNQSIPPCTRTVL